MDSDVKRLREIIDELRRMRESCEPKNADNRRYHGYSLAISGLNKVIDSLLTENGAEAVSDDERAAVLGQMAGDFDSWLRSRVPARTWRYDPQEFQTMLAQREAVEAAHLVLKPGEGLEYGLKRLHKIGRLDASVEFAALLPWFVRLFTEEELAEARRRLVQLRFPLDSRLAEASLTPPAWLARSRPW